MNIEALKIIMAQRNLSKAAIAKFAGISRQAVSLWFSQGRHNPAINIQTAHLLKLSTSLNIKIDQLMRIPEIMADEEKRNDLKARFIWDKTYPDLADFFCACARGEPRALARLVESFGMFASATISGEVVWKKFDRIKKWLHPVFRKECEKTWDLQKSLKLI